jgi:hypothetical protein
MKSKLLSHSCKRLNAVTLFPATIVMDSSSWFVSKLGSIFNILFPFFESCLKATVISLFIYLKNMVFVCGKTLNPLLLHFLGAYQQAKNQVFPKN